MEAIQALLAGLLLGFFFEQLKLPLPAPPVFSGVVGIAGVILGNVAVGMLMG